MMKINSKDAIILAAISLFNTKGFDGTSIRDIAAKANVNVATISYYFQNKDGLLDFVLPIIMKNTLTNWKKP